jgi:hypothetical protein
VSFDEYVANRGGTADGEFYSRKGLNLLRNFNLPFSR